MSSAEFSSPWSGQRRSRRRWLLGGGGLAGVVLAGLFWIWRSGDISVAGPPAAGGKGTEFRFESGGKSIRVHEFLPNKDGRRPTILLLYGSGGGGPQLVEIARDLSRHGYVAMIVNYFDLPGVQSSSQENSDRYFVQWMTLVGDAMKAASRRQHVDGDRIGLLGYSLGGYLALEVAGTNKDVAAVVDYFGGMSPLITRKLERMPPTLILHGARDQVVPVSEARTLEDLFTRKKFVFDIHIYPDQGHGFTGAAAVDARERTLRFFQKYLAEHKPADGGK